MAAWGNDHARKAEETQGYTELRPCVSSAFLDCLSLSHTAKYTKI